ncbi:hypothetical protein ROJ8625_00375 [Roseivivax jejudonensis]|uniref:Uncharacterized protein n=1 Tax=Roseivivax jejudonensis TaxID=1529041 RepID=A0A1X6Y7T5_9RHOB|nr:hypothetical protein [Roseivivax jejudonensis]SLN12924.1 hypothetical protein ROJ8625_00375 [Roseivivax jejudonensis]
MIGFCARGCLVVALCVAQPADAHHFNVYAWTDCRVIEVRATTENGTAAAAGDIQLRDDDGNIVGSFDLGPGETTKIPLDGLDLSGGLRVEVQSGPHEDYWQLTQEEIARACST